MAGVLIFYLKRWKKFEILSLVALQALLKTLVVRLLVRFLNVLANSVAESILSPS